MPAKLVFSKEEEQKMCDLYQAHRSLRKLETILGYNKFTIKKILLKNGVELAGPSEHNKKPTNPEFFETLTPESAYFLGLIVTDGYIQAGGGNSTYFGLGLLEKDSYIIEKLRDFIAPEHRLIQDRQMIKLIVGDGPLCLNIVRWGIPWHNKSYDLDECYSLFANLRRTKLLSHFVRGVIDGDGCISTGMAKRNGANCLISIVKTERFIKKLQYEINTTLGMKIGALRCDDRQEFKDRPNQYLWEVRYTGRNIVCGLGEWIYKDKMDLYLKRKYKIFMDVVKSRELLKRPKTTLATTQLAKANVTAKK